MPATWTHRLLPPLLLTLAALVGRVAREIDGAVEAWSVFAAFAPVGGTR